MDIGSLTGQIEIEDQLSNVLYTGTFAIRQFSDSFDGMTKTVLLGAGLVTTAITGMAGSIIALGNRGSDVNDVAATFQNFSGSVENAAATLENMRKGTLGTVKDFDLMKASSTLLAADVKLTADQFGTLSSAAFVLQNQGLGPTKEMLDLVSQALLTGRTRTLEMKIGKIDLAKATQDYAQQLGVEKDELTPLQELEAKRIGILETLNKKVREAGVQQRDFGEQMEFAITKVKNWGDELASRVAQSPSVMRAVQSIGSALSETFGGTAEAMLSRIVGWVDKFADNVAHYAPIVIRWVGDIIQKVQAFYNRVLEYWDTVPDWFKNIAKEAIVTAGVIYVSSESIKAFAGSTKDTSDVLASFATTVSGTRDAILSVVEMQRAWGTSLAAIGSRIMLHIDMLKIFGVQVYAVSAAQAIWAGGLGTLVTSIGGVGAAIGSFLISPLGLVVIAIGGVIGALRVLTGSWDFLLAPVRVAWQALKDVWTIMGEVASVVSTRLQPVIADIRDLFAKAAEIISLQFTQALRDARAELHLLWEIAKEFGPFKQVIDNLNRLHNIAEDIRGRRAVTQSGVGVAPLTQLPGTTIPVGGGMRIPPPALDEASEAAEKYAKKVRELLKTLREGPEDIRVFQSAFKSLTAAQLENFDIQQRVAEKIQSLAAVNATKLTPAMRDVFSAAMDARVALQEKEKAILPLLGVTLDYIRLEKEAGLTEQNLATLLGVSTQALQAYSAELQKVEKHKQEQFGITQKWINEDIEAWNTGQRTLVDMRKQYNDLIKRQTLSTTNYEIDQIDRWVREQMDAFTGTIDQAEEFNRTVLALADRRRRALFVDNDALKSHSRQALEEIAAKARATYEAMAADPENYSAKTIREFKRISEAATREANVTRSVWVDIYADVKDILSDIPDLLVRTFTSGGSIVSAMKALGVQIAEAITKPIIAALERAQKIAVSAGVGIAGAVGGAVGGTTGATIAGISSSIAGAAAASGALGAGIAGSAVAIGAVTAGVGLAAVGVYLLVKAWVSVSKEVKETRKQVAEFESQIRSTLTEQQKMEAGGVAWKETVIAVRDAYILVGKTAADAERATLALWDTGHPARARAASDEIAININLAQNIKGVRSLVQEYIGAGEKIPAALQRNIDQLVKMGKLTTENATQLLNLTKEAVPSYAEITSAAERYGIQVASLGNAVQGLRITEIATQAVTDWKMFEKAGADMNVVMEGMRDEVQGLITDSLKFGTELPKSMEPIIKRMIEAGLLTDDLGEKLVDTSKLTFAETLVEKVEKLVDAMLRLADVISNNVGGALDDISNRTVSPRITEPTPMPRIRYGDEEPPFPGFEGGTRVVEPSYYSSGGEVDSNVVAFRPRGSDVVPAMLTPGERILTAQQNREYEEEDTGGTANIYLDSDLIISATVPKMRRHVKRYGLARR